MKVVLLNWWHGIFTVLLVSIPLGGMAAGLQLVSVRSSSLNPSASGNGESGLPIISPDGRYVLFASTADNLVLTTNRNPVSGLLPASLNVFLRDRTNGTTTLVSINLAGTGGGNGDSLPMGISTNGRYALFESSAGDLVAGDTNNTGDVFVRDLVSGTTTLVSASSNGGSGNGVSRSSVMTPDGRYVAFVSAATNLVAGDTNGIPDVFVRDLQTGTTTLASVGAMSTGSYLLPSSSESPDLTPDGRFVAFFSTATNLVPDGTNAGEVYVRDLVAGTTIWASTNARSLYQSLAGTTDATSCNHAISTNGQFVAFEVCSNLASGYSRGIILRYNLQTGLTDTVYTNANTPLGTPWGSVHNLDLTPDGRFIVFVANTSGTSGMNTAIYLWDAQTGTNILISANLAGAISTNVFCNNPAIDPDGRYVAFLSNGTNLTANALAGTYHLYVRDVQAGTTRLVDVDTNGVGSGVNPTIIPALSADGSSIAFECPDGNLVPDDNNRDNDVFVRDLTTDTTSLISAHDPALPSLSPNGPSGLSTLSVSSNGLYVAFTSEADNLTANDTNGCRDVFVRDLLAGTNILVSVNTNGVAGTGISTEPAISGNGRYVAFSSYAADLVAGDANNAQDVFVRDLQSGTTVLVSASTNGGFGNGYSYSPAISADGRYVLFRSAAQNLAPSLYGYTSENIFLRDMVAGTNCALTTFGGSNPCMTPDGRYVAFTGTSNPYYLYVWDTQSATRIYTNQQSTPYLNVSISPNGHWLAYFYSSSLTLNAVDLIAKTNCVISSISNWYLFPNAGLQFSSDGRFLANTTMTNSSFAARSVYLYDFQTGSNLLVSRSFNSIGAPNNASDSPGISADGRYVAYRSFASNCVPGDFNEVPDLFLYDRLTGATTLLSVNQSGTLTANNRSSMPVFSADCRTLLFQSWASDLSGNDFNNGSDLYALDLTALPVTSSNGGPTNSASVFYAQLLPAGSAAQNPTISWPLAPGVTYQVQYKNNLNDPAWQNLPGNITFIGDTGYGTDLAPAAGQRFYRIVLVND